ENRSTYPTGKREYASKRIIKTLDKRKNKKIRFNTIKREVIHASMRLNIKKTTPVKSTLPYNDAPDHPPPLKIKNVIAVAIAAIVIDMFESLILKQKYKKIGSETRSEYF